MSESNKPQYFLFKKTTKQERRQVSFMSAFVFREPDEKWKESEKDPAEPKECLKFICAVNSPKEVAAIVRKDPLEKYVLFSGQMTEIKVAIPVFADGKALDSMSEEWEAE